MNVSAHRLWAGASRRVGAGVAAGEPAACLPQFGRVQVGQAGVEGGEDSGDAGPGPGAEGEAAVVRVEVLDDGTAGSPAGHDVRGQVEPGASGALPGRGGVTAVVAGHDEVREV